MTAFPEVHPPATPSEHPPVVLIHGGNVANWMWEPQLPAVADRLALTPDLPGFGARAAEDWPGLAGAADDVAERIRALAGERRVDVVGLSLGGGVALHLAARHPELVRSLLVSGAAAVPLSRQARAAARAQVALWGMRWSWRAQAAVYGMPKEARRAFVEHGVTLRQDNARAMLDEVLDGVLPQDLRDYSGRMLAVVGEKDHAAIRASLDRIQMAVPHAETRTAPGVHHVWSIEDVEHFNAMVVAWLQGRIDGWLREPELVHL
ncbi:alpha/beta fold hydrolase [Agrococcus sediminis]|uniref:alpha/beta fold hydrolase n=1 Tax=Agrococcus sediminis TaxID=2599924 RepID=UPI003431D625